MAEHRIVVRGGEAVKPAADEEARRRVAMTREDTLRAVRRASTPFPTLAAEVVAARDNLSTMDEVALALRDHRHRLGTSQRDYARQRGWTKTRQHRLERTPGELKLVDVVEALGPTGFHLVLCRDQNADSGLARASWSAPELVARDAADRRFPAHRRARRTGPMEPHWWWRNFSTDSRTEKPLWTIAPITESEASRRSRPPRPPNRPSPPSARPASLASMSDDDHAAATDPTTGSAATPTTLTAKLVISDADAAIAFYRKVFGATLVERHAFRGKVVFALLEVFGSRLSLKDEDEHDPSPATLGRPGVLFEITTDDPDGVASAVVGAGGTVVFEVADQPYGARAGRVRDPFGHEWLVQTPVTLSPDETEAALDAASGGRVTGVAGRTGARC